MNSSLSFWSGNVQKVTKASHFMQFWPILGPYDPLKSPLHYQESTFNGSYSLKSLHKLVLPENALISYFYGMKMQKMYPKSYNWSFWPVFGHLNPQNGRLYYQRSTFRGSYSVKCFHKLVLQENVSNPVFFELKVHLQCLKGGGKIFKILP